MYETSPPGFNCGTPWKFNIDTKNNGLEDVSPFTNGNFWLSKMAILGIYVKFRGV